MPIIFHKTLKCGCIIKAECTSNHVYCNNETTIYYLKNHEFHLICDECKKENEKNNVEMDDDILYHMWMNDNITSNAGYRDGKS